MKNTALLCALCYSTAGIAQKLEEIIVTTHPLAEKGLSQSIHVLSEKALQSEQQASLSATIASQAGINNASFGQSVGRPIIRGLGGARVKTTQDRIDSLDVSTNSSDHAVTIEPFLAKQITILKGANTLLYGANAIGGVIDVNTGRIASQLPESKNTGKAAIQAKSIANSYQGVFRIDSQITEHLVWHVDGFYRQADDYRIPGLAESAILREQESATQEAETSSVLLGSHFENRGGAVGLSYITENGFVGFSISPLRAQYGLFAEHEEEESEGDDQESPGIIDLQQVRYDVEAQKKWDNGLIEKINFRIGINDYAHNEQEGNGEIGSRILNDALEARVELTHATMWQITGVLGAQYQYRDFESKGEESFVPPVELQQFGVFWVGQRSVLGIEIETGLRYEYSDYTPQQSPQRDFNTLSTSIGIIKRINDDLLFTTQLDYTSRAPTLEELYSNGPHFATMRFEIGDTNLTDESAIALNSSVQYDNSWLSFNASAYIMEFDDFIFAQETAQEKEDLPVVQYQQQDAQFYGVDANAALHLLNWVDSDIDVNFLYDRVIATLQGGSTSNRNLPRIPAERFGLGLTWHNDNWMAKTQWQHIKAQKRTASLELPTAGYNDWSFYIQRQWQKNQHTFQAFLKVNNLLNEEQRHHSSFVKDIAPAPSRHIEFGVRWFF